MEAKEREQQQPERMYKKRMAWEWNRQAVNQDFEELPRRNHQMKKATGPGGVSSAPWNPPTVPVCVKVGITSIPQVIRVYHFIGATKSTYILTHFALFIIG